MAHVTAKCTKFQACFKSGLIQRLKQCHQRCLVRHFKSLLLEYVAPFSPKKTSFLYSEVGERDKAVGWLQLSSL